MRSDSGPRTHRRRTLLQLEVLETRTLLSGLSGPALVPAPTATQQLVGDCAKCAFDLTKTAMDGILLASHIGKADGTADSLAAKTFFSVTGDVSHVIDDVKSLDQDLMAFFSPPQPTIGGMLHATHQDLMAFFSPPQPTKQPMPPPMPPSAPPTPMAADPASRVQPQPTTSTHALFDLTSLASSPFPNNHFTVADPTQNTGLHVSLPLPDPTNPSDPVNNDTNVLNTLDGFSLQPRLSIPFDGPINPATVNSNDVFLISLGDTVPGGDKGGEVVGINQVVWDPATNTLHVWANDLLDQHTRYALIVTNGVQDTNGNPVQASEDFTQFRHDLNFGQTQDPSLKEYRKDLLDAVAAAAQVGDPEYDIVTASVFTTESATAVMEKIRDQIDGLNGNTPPVPAAASFDLPTSPSQGAPTTQTVFSLDQVSDIYLAQQTGWATDPVTGQLDPAYKSPINGNIYTGYGSAPDSNVVMEPTGNWNLDLSLLNGAVSEIAFGRYQSPDYEVHPEEYIPPVDTGPTATPPAVQGTNPIYFDLFLPSGPEPAGGWPVAIYGTGNNDIKEDSFRIAATLAEQGIATIAINPVGHGSGPDSYLTVTTTNDPQGVTFLAGGRSGIDQNNAGNIGSNEGVDATGSQSLLFRSDGIRQTAADLMQLVRVIQQGSDGSPMSVPSPDGGSSQLDPNRTYYVGQSLGANYGTVFLAVEPDVQAGVLSAPGNPIANLEWGANRSNLGTLLSSRIPSLVNSSDGINSSYGITSFGAQAVDNPYLRAAGKPYFDENMPLRSVTLPEGTPQYMPLQVTLANGTSTTIQSPVTNTVPGAMAIQEVLDNFTWASQVGNVAAYAPHLRKDPLPGMPAKSVLILMNQGDQSAPNPNATAVVRAGGLADRVSYYLHDVARDADPHIPDNPHQFLLGLQPEIAPPGTPELEPVVEMAKQQQVAEFFAKDGQYIDPLSDFTVMTPEGIQPLFEVGLKEEELPEDLNFIPPPPKLTT